MVKRRTIYKSVKRNGKTVVVIGKKSKKSSEPPRETTIQVDLDTFGNIVKREKTEGSGRTIVTKIKAPTRRSGGGGSSSNNQPTVAQIDTKLKKAYTDYGLQAREVDIITGKVENPGRTNVSKAGLNYINSLEKQKRFQVLREIAQGKSNNKLFTPASPEQLRTAITGKRNINQIFTGIKVKPETLTSRENKLYLDIVKTAKNKSEAVSVIKEIEKRKNLSQRQQLQTFLKTSIIKDLSEKDVTNINKALEQEVFRQTNNGYKLKNTWVEVRNEFKNLINKKGDITLKVLSPSFVVKVGVEVIKIIYDIGKSSALAVKGSYNYGRNLVKRGLWTKNNNPFVNDIKKLSSGTYKVTNYVLNNPGNSAAIVGIAVGLGAAITLKTIINKPEKALAEAIVFFSPTLVVKSFKVAKVSKTAVKSTISAIKNSKSKEKINKALQNFIINLKIIQENKKRVIKGKTLKGKQLEDARKEFKKFEKDLAQEVPIDKKITVDLAIKLLGYDKKSTVKESIKVILKQNKPSKAQLGLKLDSLVGKELKAAKKELNLLGYSISRVKLKRPIIDLINGRLQYYKYSVSLKINKKKIKSIPRKQKKKDKKKELKKRKTSEKEIKKIIVVPTAKQIKAAELDWKIFLNKSEFKANSSLFKNKKAQVLIFKKLSANVKELKPRYKVKKNKRKNPKRVTRKKSQKKPQNRFKSNNRKQEQKKILNEYLELQKEANRNKIKSENQIDALEKFYEKIKMKGLLTPSLEKSIKALLILLRSNYKYFLTEEQALKKIISNTSQIINETVTKSKNGRITSSKNTQKVTTDNSNDNKSIQKSKFVRKIPTPRKVKIIKPIKPPKPVKPVKPVRIPVIKPSISKIPKKGSRKGYIIRVKQGNKIVAKTTTALPENRAVNLMRRIVDNTRRASGEIVEQGKTSLQDVKNQVLAKKFTTRKGKNPKVRIQVEKKKYRLDTKGEKKKRKK